ncbi:hypothetical protein POVWA2_031970 [Plasmodium ovale wallikeri]|uniref:Uncharacterized protein n=1 Tax=Plasmodium ovale wallikeri TaxID=864142 RepID=A0A1A8YYJ5_PLAOA|nr:hypothetical protein POVWA1_032340 [Plasmodium ovale wallikeri]SBT36796.1 hypothetical protein POVWA2_031970 [Plasmodium ovale wallikeri]
MNASLWKDFPTCLHLFSFRSYGGKGNTPNRICTSVTTFKSDMLKIKRNRTKRKNAQRRKNSLYPMIKRGNRKVMMYMREERGEGTQNVHNDMAFVCTYGCVYTLTSSNRILLQKG